jgi:WD40 repeat protein
VYDAETRAQVASTILEGGRVGSYAPPMRFADDTRLAVVDGDAVAVYSARTLAPTARLDSTTSPEATAIFNRQPVQALLPEYARGFSDTTASGTLAAVLHGYSTLEIWIAGSGTGPVLSAALPADANWDTVTFSDDGSTVLVGNDSGGLLLFRGSLKTPIPLADLPAGIASLSLSYDGSRAVAADDIGTVALLDTRTDRRFEVLDGGGSTASTSTSSTQTDAVELVASPDGKWLAVEMMDELRLWDVEQRRLAATFPLPAPSGNTRTAFSADGRLLATTEPGRAVVRELPSLREVLAEPANDALAVARTFHRGLGDTRVATLRNGSATQIWMVSERGEQMVSSNDGSTGSRSVAAVTAGSGAVLVDSDPTGAGEARVASYDLGADGPVEVGRTTLPGIVTALTVSDGGRLVVLDDSVIDMSTGTAVPLTGGQGSYAEIGSALAGGGRLVVHQTGPTRDVTGPKRNTLLVWDAREGRLLAEWAEPMPMNVTAGAGWQPTLTEALGDDRVATVRPDGTVALWTVDPEAWVDRLCGLVGGLDEQQRADYLAGVEAKPAC